MDKALIEYVGGPFDGMGDETEAGYGDNCWVRKELRAADGSPAMVSAQYRRVSHPKWGDVLLYEPLCYSLVTAVWHWLVGVFSRKPKPTPIPKPAPKPVPKPVPAPPPPPFPMADFTYAAPPATVGETYNWTIQLQDSVTGLAPNLTGYAGDLQVRQQASSTVVLEASTTNGNMTLNANSVQGAVNILFASSLLTTAGQFQYELKLVDPTNNVSKPIGGLFTINPTITP